VTLSRQCTPAAWQDFAREADPGARLASLSLKRFATLIFNACPGLQPYSGALDAIYKQFSDYKQARPCAPSDVAGIWHPNPLERSYTARSEMLS
jgi:Dcp2, box A domain